MGGGDTGAERRGEMGSSDFRVGELIHQRLTEIFPRDGRLEELCWPPIGPPARLQHARTHRPPNPIYIYTHIHIHIYIYIYILYVYVFDTRGWPGVRRT